MIDDLMEYWVCCYSRVQKWFHFEMLKDYINANINYPEQDYKLISPPFKSFEDIKAWHKAIGQNDEWIWCKK